MISEKIIKRIFIACLILLPLQYAVVGVVGVIKSEPWPAFVLPAFKSVLSSKDHVNVNQIKFYVENNKKGQLIEVKAEMLFGDINQSQLQGFFRTHFADSSTVAGFNAATKRWLAQKIKKQYLFKDVNHLRIEWIQQQFRPSQYPKGQGREKKEKQFRISLHNE
jgi:hypothetical protein